MIYNITCLVCVTAMLVGCVTPAVLSYSEHDTSKITVRGGACHMDTRENSTRESIPRHESDNSDDRYNSIHDDYPEYMPRLYFFKYMHSI
jgi:hypothetical protein